MSTAWDKFQGATLSLVRSGSIKDRLADAYQNYLAAVAEDELPKEVRDDFRAFSSALTRERPMLRGDDAVRATIRKMSNDEATRAACTVVQMFGAISRPPSSAVRGVQTAHVVSLYQSGLAEA